MAKAISLIHTADFHLGRCFQDLGRQGRRLRQLIIAALGRAVGAAVDRQVDLFLVAGDLFDSPDPSGEALRVLESAFSRLDEAGVRVCVLPGTHDPPGSRAFSSPLFASRPGQVALLTPSAPAVIFDDLDAAVGAWFPARGLSRKWTAPPEGWHGDRTFRLALAHGSALGGLTPDGLDELLPDSLLNDRQVHYLALGHHHGAGPAAGSSIPAYYPGSPEMLAVDQKDAGHVLHVRLELKGGSVKVDVDRIRVGTLKHRRLVVEAAEVLAGRDPEKELAAAADPDLFMDLVVEGVVPLDAALPDWDELQTRLAPGFFKLRVTDRSRYAPGADSLAAVPEASVTAEFIRRMEERIQRSEPAERQEWEEALRLGVLYLGGGDRKP